MYVFYFSKIILAKCRDRVLLNFCKFVLAKVMKNVSARSEVMMQTQGD